MPTILVLLELTPAQSTSLWHPVPWEKKNEVQAGCVLFAVNLQLTQASATNQEGHIVLQGNNVKDVWLGGNESNNKETGRIQDRNCLSHWQDQDIIDDNAKHTIMINSTKKDGVLTKACIELSHGKNIVQPKPRLVTNSTRSFWKKKTHFPQANRLVFLVISMLLSHSWQSQQCTQGATCTTNKEGP